MIRSRLLLPIVALTGCQSYSELQVDLADHAAAFAARHEHVDARDDFDLADGITRTEARALALVFHPDCRLARLRAGVAKAHADRAGLWDDPVLALDIEKILENVAHPWLAGGALELTLPLFGRAERARELADNEQWAARFAAHAVEQDVVLAVDRAFVRWSAATARVDAATEMLERVGGLEAIAARLAEAGELTRPEARVFTLERLARADALLTAKTDADLAALAITRLVGLHPAAPVEFVPDDALAAPLRPERTPDDFLHTPRAWRLAADHGINEAQLALEIALQYPDVTLIPGFREEEAQPRLTFGVSLPLWPYRNSQAIATARAAREVSADALRAGFEQFVQDVARAELRFDAAVDRLDRIEKELVPLAERQLADSKTLAEHGALEPLLLLDSLTRVHAARLAALEARTERALRAVDITALTWIRPPGQIER